MLHIPLTGGENPADGMLGFMNPAQAFPIEEGAASQEFAAGTALTAFPFSMGLNVVLHPFPEKIHFQVPLGGSEKKDPLSFIPKFQLEKKVNYQIYRRGPDVFREGLDVFHESSLSSNLRKAGRMDQNLRAGSLPLILVFQQ
jgi:hypothetical protein